MRRHCHPTTLVALAAASLLGCSGRQQTLHPKVAGVSASRVIEFSNGRWFDGERFVVRTLYSVGGVFVGRAPARVDSVVDLQNGYVVPPYAEAHNHNIDGDPVALRARYLRDGVFYAQNPMNTLRARSALAGKINVPSSLDATFSNAGLTGPGGHPMGLYLRNLSRGGMLPTDSNTTAGFLWTVADRADLERKWPLVIASRPDFIKVLLLYSDQYERRRSDSAFFNWRGIDPALVPEVVRRSHAAGLRVMAHIETAADFHTALVAGVDMIGHMPGFRGDEKTQLPNMAPYEIPDADAAMAARRGTIVITTLGGAQTLPLSGPDSVTRRRLDSLHVRNLRMLKKHGVRVAIGSDSYRHTSLYEAEYLNSLGVFTPLELLRMWSGTTPQAIFPARKLGRLEPGYEASFLVLDADPSNDFENLKRIRLRVKQGEVLAVPPGSAATR